MIYITHEPWPASEETLAAATAAGASQIIHDQTRPEGPFDDTPSLEDAKAAKQAAIRGQRWQAEQSGTVVGGVPVRTDELSQNKIAGAVALFDKDATLTAIDFEAQPGLWVSLDKPTMTAIGVAVGRHIQACFSNAKALSTAVAGAADQAALDAIDITAGWP